VARAADHPVLGIGPRGAAPRHDADAVAVSNQTALVGLRGAGGGNAVQCRLYDRRRSGRTSASLPDDPRPESEPQSRAQGCLQRRSDRGHGAARPAAGVLPQRGGARDTGGTGALDAHPQARGTHAPALEERRALRSD